MTNYETFDSPPSLSNHAILFGVCNVKIQLRAKGLVWSQGWKALK